MPSQPTTSTARPIASQLNQECACTTLDRGVLGRVLQQQLTGEAGEALLSGALWQQIFSDSAVFLPHSELARMQSVVLAIESAAQLSEYQKAVLAWAPASSRINPGPRGAFMGYDFHLSESGSQLIEVNTNAGGAFLNAVLGRAQQMCCVGAIDADWVDHFDEAVIAMFKREWLAQAGNEPLRRVAIVDDNPAAQYLYPEFLLAQSVLQNHGIDTVVLAPEDLVFKDEVDGGKLYGANQPIDLVYNRLVDFSLEQPQHLALRQAWQSGRTVITPNPYIHALLADKRNLTVLTDNVRLTQWGVDEDKIRLLGESIPSTLLVEQEKSELLWNERRQLFFKPVASHGSKGVYRGSKITKKVFDAILQENYIAQRFVPPSERLIMVNGEKQYLKADIRLYTYAGKVLMAAARLYQGQATNFRTAGGGFAPVFIA